MFILFELYSNFLKYYFVVFNFILKKNKVSATFNILLNILTHFTIIFSIGILAQIFFSPETLSNKLVSNTFYQINLDIKLLKVILFIVLFISIVLKLTSEFFIAQICENSQKKLIFKIKEKKDFFLSTEENQSYFDPKKYILGIRGISVFEKFVTGLMVSLMTFVILNCILIFYNPKILFVVVLSLILLLPLIFQNSLKIIRRIRDIRSNGKDYRIKLIQDINNKKDQTLFYYESYKKSFGLQLFLSKMRVSFGYIFLLFLALFIFFVFILKIKIGIILFIIIFFMLKSLLSLFFSINSMIRRYDEVKQCYIIINKI